MFKKTGKDNEAPTEPIVTVIQDVVPEAAPISVVVTPNYPVLKQLIKDGFLSLQSRFVPTADGLQTQTIWLLTTPARRGQNKKEIEIRFCPVTGIELQFVNTAMLK